MKRLTGLLVVAVFLTLQLHGQDVAASKAQLEAQSAKKASEKAGGKMTGTVPSIAPKTVGSQLSYQGFLAELAKSGKPLKLIDPRLPLNPKKDSDNLHRDPQTGKIKGFVLFAIKF